MIIDYRRQAYSDARGDHQRGGRATITIRGGAMFAITGGGMITITGGGMLTRGGACCVMSSSSSTRASLRVLLLSSCNPSDAYGGTRWVGAG